MKVTEKVIRQVTEMKYLNADNVDRYRCIMRIFFENYEKLRYWMYQEDVYQIMIQDPYFENYRMEQCQQDLSALTEWKNLVTVQDTRKVSSVEEFKNKKFRYQMSEYSVEIERLVLRLENLSIEGASLEPNLLERIQASLEEMELVSKKGMMEVATWWNDLNNDFIRLNQNYQDYIRELNSIRAEEMMRTKEFLVFKDKLIDYLRSFIKGLQRHVGIIEEHLRQVDAKVLADIFYKVNSYELSIPRIDVEVSLEMIQEKTKGRYESIYEWFVGRSGLEGEAGKLFDATNDIIRRITRYAAQISEKNALGGNRREEYRKMASVFLACSDMNEAHKLSAMVFGMEQPYHLKGDFTRETDSMNGGVYEEKPLEYTLKPRSRSYREKTVRSAMKDLTKEKARVREETLQRIQEEKRKLAELEKEGIIDFSTLPVIEPKVRNVLLKWLSNGLEDIEHCGKTDNGRTYVLDLSKKNEKCIVRCEDGNFTMPAIRIVFQGEVL